MLEIIDLKKVYPLGKGKEFVVLEHLNLLIKKGEFISIIGHSGCGKSTVLSMVAGLNPITEGSIAVAGRGIMGPGPDRGIVFQSPCLFPWMTALENVMLGVNNVFLDASKKDKLDLAMYFLNRVGLGNDLHKRASELSNGMQQRVGIARAFAIKPKLLLLDEPFGMLDSLTRYELQEVLMEVWTNEKITAVMVTHDVDEAVLLSDRVIMMTAGPKAKIGKELEITFERPRPRQEFIEKSEFYEYRSILVDFLENHESNHTSFHKNTNSNNPSQTK